MRYHKNPIKNYFKYFAYFFTQLRYRLFITLALSLSVAVLDGFGLAMFMPLLQVASGAGEADAEALGNLRFLVDALFSFGITISLGSVLIVILVFFVTKGITRFGEAYYEVWVLQYFMRKIRLDSLQKLSTYDYKAFLLDDSGRIQNTLSGEVARVALAYQNYMATMQAATMVFAYFSLAFLANPEFALLVVLGGFISNLFFHRIYKKTKEASRKITYDGHVYQGLLIQEVAFFKYLKATNLIKSFTKKLSDYVVRIEESNRKMGLYAAILTAAREPLVVLVVVGVIMVQVMYFSRNISLIILSLMFFYRSMNFIMNLQTHWNRFLNASGALENITEFMQRLTQNQEHYNPDRVASFDRQIELRNVGFRYDEIVALKNINLTIRKNETIAFVGESGSGKTTLVNVLTGLLAATNGEMYIDDKPIHAVHLPSWRERIGYITQEPVIFSDSIFNNVTFWAEPTDENKKRFWNALEKATIAEFVRLLPQQENYNLGAGGGLVSGGQKQRLSIARELYKDIDILIMDEATSSLDSETEQLIQQNIESLRGHYTLLIIAHRLATIKSVDRIVVMRNGEIESEGQFDFLLSRSGVFNRMVILQEL